MSLSWSIPGQMVTKHSFTAGKIQNIYCILTIYLWSALFPSFSLSFLPSSHGHTHTLTHITHTQIWQPILRRQPVHQSFTSHFLLLAFTISRRLVRNSFHSVSLANSTEGCSLVDTQQSCKVNGLLGNFVKLVVFWWLIYNTEGTTQCYLFVNNWKSFLSLQEESNMAKWSWFPWKFSFFLPLLTSK